MEMDFRSMKRKELQAHCKKHGLPANLTNSQMAESLESLLLSQEKAKVKPKGCLKGSGGSGGASKKVSFTLEEEEKLDLVRNSGRRKRRSSVAVAAEVVPESDVPARPRTRSLAKAVVWSPVVGKKARRSTESVRANDESIPVINLSSDDEKMEEEKVPATRALRSRVVGVSEGEDVKMAEKKAAVEVTATRSLRGRVVTAGEGEGTKREKKPAGEVPATRLLRSRDVVAGEGEEIQNDMDDAKKMEKKPSEKAPVTRSLRNRAVVAVESETTQMDVEPRQTRKRARAVEGADDGKVPEANLNGDGEEDATKAEKKSEAPAARSLRNRTVVVGGDKAMVGDIEPRKTRRSQKAAKGAEAEEAKSGESEGAEKKDLMKQKDNVVPAVLVLSVDDSQKDVPPKEAPVRLTRRMLSKPETSQSEVEMHGTVEARTEADGDNVRDEGITVRRKKTRKQGEFVAFELDSESLTEVAPSQALTELRRKSKRGSRRNEPLSDESVIEDKAVNDKKAGRRARKTVEEDKEEGETRKQPVASKAKKSSAPKSDSATEMETIEVHKGICRAVSSDESNRKSSHNANNHNLVSVEDGKPEDGDMAAGENIFSPRPRGARRQRIVRKAKEIPAPENETVKELEAVDVQDEAQRDILNEDSPRKSGQNPPGLNVPVPLDRKPDHVDMIIGETECVEASPKLNLRSNLKRKHEKSNAEVGACTYLVEKVTEVQQPVLTDDFSGSPSQNDQLKRSGSDKSPVLSLQNDDVSLASPFCGKSSGTIEIAQSHIEASVVKAVGRVLEVTGHQNLNVEVDVLPGRMDEAASEGIMDADNIRNLQYMTLEQEDGARTMTEVLNAESTKSRLVPDIEEVAQETNHEDVIVSANSYGAKETALNINSSSPIPTSCHQDETDGCLAVHEARDIIDLRQSLSYSEEYSQSKFKEATQDTDHELVTVPANSSFVPLQTSFPQDKTDGVLAGHEETAIIGAPVSLSHSNELSPSEFKESTKETDAELVAARTNSSGLPIQTSCHQDKTDGHLAGHETTNTISVPLSFSINDELSPSDIKEASQETDLELVTAPANSSGFPIQMSFLQDKTDGLLTGQENTNFIGLPLSFTNNEVLSPSDVKEATQEIDFELFTAHANSSDSPIPTSCKLDETDDLLVNVSCNSDFAEVSFKREDETTLTHVNLLSEGNDGVEIGGTQNDEENTRGDVSESFQPAEGISNDAIFEAGSGSNCNAKDSNILVMPVEDRGHSNIKFSDINDETTEHVLTDMERENVRELVEDFKGNSPSAYCIKSVQEETENLIKSPVPELVHGFSNVEMASLESPRCSDDDSDIGAGVQDAITVVDNTPDNDMAPQIVGLEVADAEPYKYVTNEATSEIGEDVLIVVESSNAEDFQDSKDNSPSRSDCVGTLEQVVVLEVTEHYSKTSLESAGSSKFNSDVAEGVKHKHDNDMEDQIATMEDVEVVPHKSTTDGGDGCFINTLHHGYDNSNPEVTNITDGTNENVSHGSDTSPIISDENPDDFTPDSVNLRSASIDEEQTCQETPHATRVHVVSEVKESNTMGCNSHFSENLSGVPRECFVSPSLLFGTMNDDLGSDKEGDHGKTSLKDTVIRGSDQLASGSRCSPDHFNSTDATFEGTASFEAQSVGCSAMIASAVTKDSPNLNTYSIELAATCQIPQIPLSVVDIAQDNSGHVDFKSNSEDPNCLDDDSPSEGESGAALAELFSEDYKDNSSSPTPNTPEELTKFQNSSCPQTDKQCTASNIPICEQEENTTVVRDDSGENNNLSDVKKLPDSAEKLSVVSKFSDSKGMTDKSVGSIASNFKTNTRGFKCFDDSSLSVGDSGAAMTRLFSEDNGDDFASPIANTPEVAAKHRMTFCPQTDKQTPASIIAFREQRENVTVCDASSENYGSYDLRKIPDSVEGLSVVSKFADLKGKIVESGGSIPSHFKGNSEKPSCLDDESLSAGYSKDALAGLFCEDYRHPSASRFANTGPKSLDDDSLARGDSGAALEGLFSWDYNHPSVSSIANTPEQVAKFQKFSCRQMDTQVPAAIIALKQGENFTVVLDASTEDHNTSGARIVPDCIEELPAVGMGDKSPGNNNEQSTVSPEARDDGNNGHSRVKSPCSLYGLNEGFSVGQLGDSVVRGSREVSLGLSSSQKMLELSMDQDLHKENLVDNFDSPCYQSPHEFSVARDRQICEDGSSSLEVNDALSLVEKDLKVSLDDRPFSLSTSWPNTADYAEVTLGMSSSHTKFEAFQVHDKHKEAQVVPFEDGSSRLEVNDALSPVEKDLKVSLDDRPFSFSTSRPNTADYAEVTLGMSSSHTKFEAIQVHDKHKEAQVVPFDTKSCSELHLPLPGATAEQDSNVSINESPFSLSIFKQSADDVEVTGSAFCTSTTTASQYFNLEFKTDLQQGNSEQGIIVDSNVNVSTVLECESLGEKEDTIVRDEFVGEPVKDLCSPLSIKRSSDGAYITPTIATSILSVTDSKGFPGQESTMPIGSSFSAEKLDYANSTDVCSKDTDILTGGSTNLQSDSVDEVETRQEMGDLENFIGLKELFSPEHKVNYSSSSFLVNENATTFSEASPTLNPDQESEMPTLLETPGRDMAADANDTSHIRTPGHSDEMTEEFLTKSPSVSKYVATTNVKVSEQSLNPEQKVDELEAVQETEVAYVDIRTSQLYGSPLCRPFSESVDSRLNAVDSNLLRGTDERQVNDDDVLSLDGSSFALNIFENEDSICGNDSGSSDHSQDTIWESLEETESVAVVDEMEDKIVNDMKSTDISEQQANNPSDGIAEKIEMTMHIDELDRKVICGVHLISNVVDNLDGKIHGAALTSSSSLQTPDPQGSSTSRKITKFEDIASTKKSDSGLGTSGLFLAGLQNLEKSNAEDGSSQEVLDSHKISSSPKNFRPLGYLQDMNITEMGDMSDNFTDQADDGDVSIRLCDTSDRNILEDHEVFEMETKNVMDVESNLGYHGQGDEPKEIEPFLVVCDDTVPEAAVLPKTNDALLTVASVCDMKDGDRELTDMGFDRNLEEDYVCNDNEPVCENSVESSETIIFANAEIARIGEEITHEGSESCPIMPTVDCSPIPSKLDCDEIKGSSGSDTMNEINRRLTNFRITTARKLGRIQSTPLKQVKSLKFESAIDMLKDKENMSVMKTDRPPQSNIEKSAKASSVRRPLQRVEKNNNAGQ